ncbi:tetratricopeptide repeat protein [Sneathiella sp.]|uniref:tetratricopeptide repeat protein n=1 Tax=Sneathiella sp. TaxID=1964365 RepID=UPI00356814D9
MRGKTLAYMVSCVIFFTLPFSAPVTATGTTGIRDARSEYDACLKLVKREPEKALESGLAWRDLGGGFPARHCVALALVEMKKYDIAAPKLEELAEDMEKAGSNLVVPILSQAANAWLLAGHYSRADSVASAALGIDPENIDLLIDRSRIMAKTGDYQKAFEDLDLALKLDPTRADALTFRAAALRQLGETSRALEDVELALSLQPDLLDALIERGILYQLQGKDDDARQDWLKVINLSPNSAAADLARLKLEKLDVHTDK